MRSVRDASEGVSTAIRELASKSEQIGQMPARFRPHHGGLTTGWYQRGLRLPS